MDIESILSILLAAFLIIGISLWLLYFGLNELGIIKPKELNGSKWIKTTAIVTGSNNVTEKVIGKHSPYIIYYTESSIVYKANGKRYKKYVKNLPDSTHRVCILYKRKNPNYFKLVSELNKRQNISKPCGVFLCILSLFVFICGCLIISSI